ncbi:DMT family transporter [Photobacterium kasasachensis]|uniref:DMT family transporter n=1 Tax=Photobacterium kasasachensis TaxID=2910240 RepID=UPI003D147887
MRHTTKIWLGVLFAIFFWGSNFNAIQGLSPSMTPIVAATIRFGVACACLLLLRLSRRTPESSLSRRDKIYLLLLAFIGVLVQNCAIFISLDHTSAVNASIIIANMPLAGLLLSALILNTQTTRYHLIGAAVSLVGVLLVLTKGNWQQLTLQSGDVLALLALVSGCLYTVLAKKWVSHIPLSQFLRWTLGAGFIQMALIACWLEHPLVAIQSMTQSDMMIILYMGICGTLVAYYFWMQGTQVIGPRKVTSMFNLIPVFTLVISMALGTMPYLTQLVGIVLVTAGVVIANSNDRIKSFVQTKMNLSSAVTREL